MRQDVQKIIYNVLRCPKEMRDILAKVYGEYRHFNAGRGLIVLSVSPVEIEMPLSSTWDWLPLFLSFFLQG